MNRKELEAFAREAAKTLKTEKDLNEFSQMLNSMSTWVTASIKSPLALTAVTVTAVRPLKPRMVS